MSTLGWTFDNTLVDYVTGLAPTTVTTGAYAASGGTITAVAGNRIHTFTTVGTDSITFSSPGTIQLLVVAGGGGGGATGSAGISAGGGGGAGEVAYYASYPVNAGTYTVVVGNGGLGGQTTGTIDGADGFPSSFGTLQANGGGGGSSNGGSQAAYPGGSGGGVARGFNSVGGAAVKTAGGRGNAGGTNTSAANFSASGGGGAGSAGANASASGTTPIAGGSGYSVSISGAAVTYGAGGTGGARSGTYTPGAGTTNRGDGGDGYPGGTGAGGSGANGGSGIVIISYSTASFAPTFVSGEYRKAIYFQNYISTGTVGPSSNVYYTVPLNSSTGYTIAFWVNFSVGGIFAQSPIEVSLASGGRAVNIYIDASNILISYDGNGGGNITATPAVSIGAWNHIALVIQGTTRILYLNGVSFSGTSGLTGTQSGFILGGGLSNYSALCAIDDLRVYNTALNSTQVQALYAANGVPPPVSQLNFTGISGGAGSAYGATTLLTQVSPANAVVGYSLRAINATTAVVANIAVQIALPSMTSAATSIGSNSYSQALTSSFPSGGSGTYIATGSSLYNSTTGPAWRAFDNDTSTYWETTGNQYSGTPGTVYGGTQTTTVGGTAYPGEWIQIQMPEAMALDSYSMYGRVSYIYRMPYNWIVAGSNDGTTWTQVDSQSGQGGWRGYEPSTYTVNSTTQYLYFRLVVTAIVDGAGAQNVNLAQWTIYASKSSWTRDVSADIYGNLTTSTGQDLLSYLGTASGFVATWYDQSGAGNDASRSIRSGQPIIQKSSIGPGWSLLFDGAADYLTGMSYTVLNNTNYSFSLIERRNTGAAIYAISSGNNTADQGFHFGYASSTIVRFGQYSDDLDINPYPAYTYTGEPLHYWAGTESSTSGRFIYENGTVSVSDVTKTTLLSSASGNFTVGARLFGAIYYYSGELYEVIVWKRALSQAEATQVYNNQYGYINGNPGTIIFT
jgi:hypothetical protein